jgi:restriction endonuclease S subunit
MKNNLYLCAMKQKSNLNTKNKTRLHCIAEVLSGVYIKNSPTGDIFCLQVKDLLMSSPETTATRIDYIPKLDNYLLKNGDLLFAGKGTTYLCQVFNLGIPAVPSTTLYSIRLHTNLVSPDYLCWYLNHPSIVATIKTAQAGSGTPLIHKSTLEKLEIIIPDIETQRKIVELSTLQKREKEILEAIAEKRMQVTNQILINELKK